MHASSAPPWEISPHKIEAIKRYREQTGMGLKQAKDAVEAIERGGTAPLPAGVDEPFRAELLNLLDRGQKIEAIKLYRERTGAGLKQAKEAVEALAARQGLPARQGAGCLALVAFALGLGIGAYALAQGAIPTIFEAQRDGAAFLAHTAESQHQAGLTRITVPEAVESPSGEPKGTGERSR